MSHSVVLPYRVAYSNGQDVCSKCQTGISAESLQLGVMEQSLTDDCMAPKWYCKGCFFQNRRPACESVIDGYANLRYKHQLEIRKQLGNGVGAKKRPTEADSENKPPVQLPINEFSVEYARSERVCGYCQKDIELNRICIMKITDAETLSQDFSCKAAWYHVPCFVNCRVKFGWLLSGEKLPGFKKLKDRHKAKLIQCISSIKTDDEPLPKKMKKVHIDSEADAAYQKQIEKQNRDYFDIRDKLNANTNNGQRNYILRVNNQFVPEDENEILDHLTDVLCFGAIKECPQCKDGNFVFRNLAYCCTGSISAWSMCPNIVKEPERHAVEMPETFNGLMSVWNRKLKVRHRIVKGSSEMSDDDLILHKKQPLFNMEFCIFGETTKSHDEIEEKIQQMGGKLVDNIHKNLTAVISNLNEVEKMGTFMQQAKKYGIHVVPDDIVDDIAYDEDDDPVCLIRFQDLGNWGKNIQGRVPLREILSEENLSNATSIPKVKNLKLKTGGIVDPDSGLEKIAHVYCNGSLKYSVVLDLVDINTNRNSYFKMQLLESDTEKKYWLFESKGRIATAIGSNDWKPYMSLSEAQIDFAKLYFDKTGNHFGTANFVKKPGKYNQMHIEYESETTLSVTAAVVPSKLSEPVFKLMELLFDLDIIQSTLIAFDLDTDKMPLGKISVLSIVQAHDLLQEIDVLLTQANDSMDIVALSNQFYMLIPHKFGIRRPPKIDSHEMVQAKLEMLAALLHMETTYTLLTRNSHKKMHPIDEQFEHLNTDIEVLDKQTTEYEEILKYVKNTQSSRFNDCELEVEEVFKVSRHGEAERFKPHETNFNRQLLWHGTRLTNVVSILSNGLQIKPANVPTAGSNFGHGIYFADSVSKSANYCHPEYSNGTGLLLLCEVAVGRCDFRYHVDRKVLDPQCHSIKGFGQLYPNPFLICPNGLKIPNGKLQQSTKSTQMTFNEFVIFDETQVKVQYLVKMKFAKKA